MIEEDSHVASFKSRHNLRIKKANSVMQTKNGASSSASISYEDFEPFCNWRRDDECETLVVHLPAFKKEQLKVQIINTIGTLKISGERLVDATKRSRFYKEITIPKDCNTKEIHAKFAAGLLHIVMPKKGLLAAAPDQKLSGSTNTPQIQHPEVNKKSTPDQNFSQDDQLTKLPTLPEPDNAIGSLNKGMVPGNIAPDDSEPQLCDSRSEKSMLRRATNVAVMVVMVACIGAYIMYSYRYFYTEDLVLCP